MRTKNWSFKKITKELGISKPTLIEWSKELNQKIANMKAIELEAIQEKKVKDNGDYSYYDTIRSALERGQFSERMINSFMQAMDNEELNEIIKNEYNNII